MGLDLASIVQKSIVSTLQGAVSGVVKIGTYKEVGVDSPVYDPATNSLTSGDVTHLNIRMTFMPEKQSQDDYVPVDETRMKVLIAFDDLPGATPKTADQMTVDGATWHVIKAANTADALYTLTVRKA